MVQHLRLLNVLREDPSSIPSTYERVDKTL